MRLVNLTPFPIRVGSATAPEIPSSCAPGNALRAVSSVKPRVEMVEFDGLGEVRVEYAQHADSLLGWPTLDCADNEETPAIIIPLAVANTLREMGRTAPTGGMVLSPGMVKEEGGVKYVPNLVRHADLEIVYRGTK